MKHRVTEELNGVVTFLVVIWAVFLLDWLMPADFNEYGLIPRSLSGAIGVISMPFLHNDWGHLTGNTVPLIVLLCLLAGARANSLSIVPQLVVASGVLLWMFGRNSAGDGRTMVHVGASGLVFALITFLIVSGIQERRFTAFLMSLAVGLLYGTTLLTGMLPLTVPEGVSWDGHLYGAIAGFLVAKANPASDTPTRSSSLN